MKKGFIVLLCFLLNGVLVAIAAVSHAANTRGLAVMAKDPSTGLQGEVKLYNKSYAVIIGIDRYQNLPPDRHLMNAVKDAIGVQQVLSRHYRFDKIIVLKDEEATKERIMRLLTAELPRKMSRDDALFVFWAGHGNQEKSDYGDLGYLIPYDGSADEIYRNITMAEIRDTISKKLPAKHVFYAFDACYSGLLTTRSIDSKSRRDLGYLKEITKEPVRQVLTAGGKGEEALDGGSRGHSVFTGRLIEALENAQDFITANELQAGLRERVSSDARGRGHIQTPAFGPLYGMGDFVFIPKLQDRLGDLEGASVARQKELEQLKKMEADAALAKQKEQTEIARKQAELDGLDKQIAEMKARLGTSAARATDSLDAMLAMAEQKAEHGRHLEELRRQKEEEERKRQQEIASLKQEAIRQKEPQIRADLAKYEKIATNKYAQDMKGNAWDALIAAYPEARGVARYNTDAFLGAVGLTAGWSASEKPVVRMETTLGSIKIELYAKDAPASVTNFLDYVQSGFYEGTIFHRVIPGFMAQGGGFTPDRKQKATRAPIKNEGHNGLKNDRGTIAMARTSSPNSATSQFFINVVNNDMLNSPKPDGFGYAVFGRVIEGMDIVDRIVNVKTQQVNSVFQNLPERPIIIESVKLLH